MRITRDAINESGFKELQKAVENAERDGRNTIRAEDIS